MANKILDYLTKGLSLEARQTILEKIKNISTMSLDRILEKTQNYPVFRRMGYTDKDIEDFCKNVLRYFKELNDYMASCGRDGLFSDTSDAYKCSKEYFELIKVRDEIELENIMGASYDKYIPKNR